MSKDAEQDFEGADESDTGPPRRGRAPTVRERPFKLGPLGTLNQVIVALGKSIRAMADGTFREDGGIELDRGKLDAGLREALRERCLPEHVETEFTRIMDAVFRV